MSPLVGLADTPNVYYVFDPPSLVCHDVSVLTQWGLDLKPTEDICIQCGCIVHQNRLPWCFSPDHAFHTWNQQRIWESGVAVIPTKVGCSDVSVPPWWSLFWLKLQPHKMLHILWWFRVQPPWHKPWFGLKHQGSPLQSHWRMPYPLMVTSLSVLGLLCWLSRCTLIIQKKDRNM